MTSPVGKTASAGMQARVFLDDDFEERLNAQINSVLPVKLILECV